MKKILPFALVLIFLLSGCVSESGKGTTLNESDFLNSTNSSTLGNFSIFSIKENKSISLNWTEFEIANKCVELCQAEVADNQDMSNGPCISDKSEDWPINSFACDIVHFPRDTEIDNDMKNQCNDYIELRANRFIEVSQDCSLVRIV